MNLLAHLHTLTNRILDAPKHVDGKIFTAADELYKFLLQATNIDTNEEQNRNHIGLKSGNAIGLSWAAMCIRDFMRTKRFMDGIHLAVANRLKKNNTRPVHIIYAGTGPFATLILPLTARFSPSQLQFTLLEVNEYSFHCLQRLIGALQLESYVRQLEIADATLWTIPDPESVDMLISETMNYGLIREPQVAIFMNIIPQLRPDAIIIPENIQLEAALIDTVKRMSYKTGKEKIDESVYSMGNIFEVSKKTILEHAIAFKRSGGQYKFPATTVTVPGNKIITHSELSILTQLIIHDTVSLLHDESPLTMPLKLTDIKTPAPETIKFYYETGERPGVRFGFS